MVRRTHYLMGAVAMVLLSIGVELQAANIEKAIVDAESRRRGAADSLREIMAKSDAQMDQARISYTNAVSSQNAWLDLICQAIEPEGATLDVTAASLAAASALMDWVTVGGRALGLPALSDSFAAGLKKSITQDLIDIGNSTLKSYGRADEAKRTQAITSLKARLRWKTPEELM